eukprot:1541763-Rhodomonas_salina.2
MLGTGVCAAVVLTPYCCCQPLSARRNLTRLHQVGEELQHTRAQMEVLQQRQKTAQPPHDNELNEM